MRKYGGSLIHVEHDEHGPIEVVQTPFERTLHFGNAPKQSSMLLDHPVPLVLSYTRAMAAALLLNPYPRRVLLVGLGGGSLARFFVHHFPDCRVDAVELRPAVLAVARAHFALPEPPQLRVLLGDALEFMAGADRQRFSGYDLILVDAFDAAGVAGSVCRTAFLHGLAERLAPEGAVAMNLWAEDHVPADTLLLGLEEAFGRRPLRLPVAEKDNLIALTGRVPMARRDLRRLGERARDLQEWLGVEFPAFLKALRKANGLFR